MVHNLRFVREARAFFLPTRPANTGTPNQTRLNVQGGRPRGGAGGRG